MFDPGSFRDPDGRVFHRDGRVFRLIRDRAAADYEYVRDHGLLRRWEERGAVIPSREIDRNTVGPEADTARYVLEHPRLDFISYPYEWPFPALKAAALFHLDLQLEALEEGVQLCDASAYNVQFLGARPVFIDVSSFRRYQEGDFWAGHRQFCMQFLNPLVLQAVGGVPYHAWYRGSLEGIGSAEINRLLPAHRKLSLNVLSHIVVPARWEARARRSNSAPTEPLASTRRLPRASYRALLIQLRDWIARLRSSTAPSSWSNYTRTHSYSPLEQTQKQELVSAFIGRTRPQLLWDFGCSTGEYAFLALQAGAREVIGFDADHASLEAAFLLAREQDARFLPLYLDAGNPAPDQGWAGVERKSLRTRGGADALLALALVHHLAIARNVPLDFVLSWLTSLAPRGIIEFVPKRDPMLQRMLAHRTDIFDEYDEDTFAASLSRLARVEHKETVSTSGRTLFIYTRS